MDEQSKEKGFPIPIIIGGILIFAVIGYGLFAKFNKESTQATLPIPSPTTYAPATQQNSAQQNIQTQNEQSQTITQTPVNALKPANSENNNSRIDKRSDGCKDGHLGISVQILNSNIAKQLQTIAKRGLVITDIDPNGCCAAEGIEKNDIILEINGKVVVSLEEFQKVINETNNYDDTSLSFLIERRGENLEFKVTPSK